MLKLTEKQEEAFSSMVRGDNVLISSMAGCGKCLSGDTRILMYDGSVKIAKDIIQGDKIMGDDSSVRNVLSTTSGYDYIFLITNETKLDLDHGHYSQQDTYKVNSHHILSLKVRKRLIFNGETDLYSLYWGDKSGVVLNKSFENKKEAIEFRDTLPDIVDLSLKTCLDKKETNLWSIYFQTYYAQIEFSNKEINLDPYILGLWLGTQKPNEDFSTFLQAYNFYIMNYFKEYAKQTNTFLIELFNNFFTFSKSSIMRDNWFQEKLNSYNLNLSIQIPLDFKTNTRTNRLKLLAGLIDSLGYETLHAYEILLENHLLENKQLEEDIVFLIKSLNFKVIVKTEKHKEFYKRIRIYGKLSEIPSLVFRTFSKHKYDCIYCNDEIYESVDKICEHCSTTVKILPVEHGKYYGFELDDNHRFVLDNFIVTHNTACVKMFVDIYKRSKIIGITSTTGISALLFGGTTLHSYLGIGLGNLSVNSLVSKITKKHYLKKRWNDLEILVIDEVSMLSPLLFDKLEETARLVRNDNRPFGGIQLILSGDFCQLPCVGESNFCFEAKSWNTCIDKVVYLDKNMRQKDEVFQKCLSEIRVGKISEETKNILNQCVNKELENEYGIKPTRFCSTKNTVEKINNSELDKFAETGEFYEYDMTVSYTTDSIIPKPLLRFMALQDMALQNMASQHTQNIKEIIEQTINTHKKNCIAPQVLQICIGAQVMLLCNAYIDQGLANGSRGVVIRFENDLPIVKFLNGNEIEIGYHTWEIVEHDKQIMTISQIPLILAYALTIHKSQGCTLDYAEIDLSEIFEYGQAYVALSRVKELKGLSIRGSINFNKIQAHPKAVEFYK